MIRKLIPLLILALAGPGVARPESPRAHSRDATRPTYGATPQRLIPYRETRAPYRRLFTAPPAYRGPGRTDAAPAGLETIRIGLLAPLEGAEGSSGRSLRRGVELAIEEANAAGGRDGVPFELRARNDMALWGSSSNTLVQFAYTDHVWALIGSPDSTSTHVALRAALKAELPIINVGGSDPTLTETGIPWLIRCTPDDRQTSYRLARTIFEARGFSRVALIRASSRYGRFGVREFRDAARRLGRPLPMEVLFSSEQRAFTSQLTRIAKAGIEAVVLWAKPAQAASIVRQMRERGMSQPIFGTDRLVSSTFLRLAGPAAEGVRTTSWMNLASEDPKWIAFRHRFHARFGTAPDAMASYGFDAASLVVAAIRTAGLNRARIRDALAGRRTYHGVTGLYRFDVNSNNIAPLTLARVKGGRFVFH